MCFVCTRVRLRLCDVTPGALCAERTFLFCRIWRSESWIWVLHDCCLICIFLGFCVAEQGNYDIGFQVLPGHMPNGHSTIRLFAKSCSVLVILTDPNDFRDKNHDFSARGTNCLKRVIEAVQNVKITFFSASTSCKSIFRDIFVIFVGSPSRIFRKITILHTILTIRTW